MSWFRGGARETGHQTKKGIWENKEYRYRICCVYLPTQRASRNKSLQPRTGNVLLWCHQCGDTFVLFFAPTEAGGWLFSSARFGCRGKGSEKPELTIFEKTSKDQQSITITCSHKSTGFQHRINCLRSKWGNPCLH